MSFSQIKELLVERGATPSSVTDIFIPFPKTVLENMVGTDLYAWVCVYQNANIPYTHPYFRGTVADNYQEGRQEIYVSNVRVELTK